LKTFFRTGGSFVYNFSHRNFAFLYQNFLHFLPQNFCLYTPNFLHFYTKFFVFFTLICVHFLHQNSCFLHQIFCIFYTKIFAFFTPNFLPFLHQFFRPIFFGPLNYFLNDELHIILKLRSLFANIRFFSIIGEIVSINF